MRKKTIFSKFDRESRRSREGVTRIPDLFSSGYNAKLNDGGLAAVLFNGGQSRSVMSNEPNVMSEARRSCYCGYYPELIWKAQQAREASTGQISEANGLTAFPGASTGATVGVLKMFFNLNRIID